ncbi:MAG: DNA-3-methyladenine glycosylase [Candidatus Geothermarchaeales archaeon]
MGTLPRSFYQRDAARVARSLLGALLVRRTKRGHLVGRIVEAEAYFGSEDPASRAYRGRKRYNEVMWGRPGISFVYMVHANWLLNVITGVEGVPAGVLIRAVEPVGGIELMQRNRGATRLKDLTSGPGKLTQAFGISKAHHDLDLTNPRSEVFVAQGTTVPDEAVGRSHRVGVKKDLPAPLRFFVRDNDSVSK